MIKIKWRRWIAAAAIGASAFGVAACDGGDGDVPEDISEEKEDITEEKQDIQEDIP